jgi:hypothetical protein
LRPVLYPSSTISSAVEPTVRTRTIPKGIDSNRPETSRLLKQNIVFTVGGRKRKKERKDRVCLESLIAYWKYS